MNEAIEEDDIDIDSLSIDEDEEDEEEETVSKTAKKKKKNSKSKSKNNKRRFSDEQVRSLETIFELETKLEPKKKVQVARELGLQPRQVAIWFQNKRARWKSKEIEKNYRVLKLNYDSLKVRVDVQRKDKESLLTQLQELRGVVDKQPQQTTSRYEDVTANNNPQDNKAEQHRDNEAKLAAKSSISHEEIDHQSTVVYSDGDKSGNIGYLYGQEQPELLSLSENIDGSITSIASPVKWCSFDADGSLFDQSSSSSHWWESWT